MLELLNHYSIQQILIFVVTLALAIKGVISYFDWAKLRLKASFDKEEEQQDKIESVKDELIEVKENFNSLFESHKEQEADLKELMAKVNLLIDSDKDDIKAYITDKHHFYFAKKWIDDYSMDCIERRYEHYREEKGNSFVKKLMEELRDLPNQPPQ